jgi:hypothetical protein
MTSLVNGTQLFALNLVLTLEHILTNSRDNDSPSNDEDVIKAGLGKAILIFISHSHHLDNLKLEYV